MDVCGDHLDRLTVPLSIKMEELLRTARAQRALHRQRRHVILTDNMWCLQAEDMRTVFNTWRHHVETWMKPSTLEKYRELQRDGHNNAAQQLGKSSFSTYTFQLSGCKFLLRKLIELPIIASVEQPAGMSTATLIDLIDAYEQRKTTQQYQDTILRAVRHQKGQLKLSRRVWLAQYNYSQGKTLSFHVRHNSLNFFDLTKWQQEMIEAFDTRRSAKELDLALQQKEFRQQPYRGAGTEIGTAPRLQFDIQ